uniref:protein-L-isoaspartate(D-aspartate) O-methyltransferase n=1 Tax=Trypanosoma congolense (strain IL3000) TaxID=1068625 RepID=G0UWY2_TRYCI|nr:putative protein-L-isoaspartate [Trypanosoma congolense IL3000]
MAWTCSGTSNSTMVQRLVEASLLVTPAVVEAFNLVDRGWFLPRLPPEKAYRDEPAPIGYGATISAPHMHATMAEIIAPFLLHAKDRGTATALDVGSGSGYLTAVLAALCGKGGKVIGVEHVPVLVAQSSQVIRDHFLPWVEEGRIRFVEGDGRDISRLLGKEKHFDVIHVGAAAETVPQDYIDSLNPGGCLVIPVGGENEAQVLRVYTKSPEGAVSFVNHCGVRFVPLTSLKHQEGRW